MRAPMVRLFPAPDTTVIDRPGWHQVLTPSTSTRNEVILSQVEEADADRVISETIATYRAHGRQTKWCVGYWTTPADFGERLLKHGFVTWDVRGMGCSASLAVEARGDVAVEEVTERNLDEYLAMWFHGWALPPKDEEIERQVHLAGLSASPRTGFLWIARMNGHAVGTAGLVLRGDYGYLLGTHVLEAARGRGAYRALVAARLAFLRSTKIEYAVTQAREKTSAPMLEHLGFETLFRAKCYLLEP